MWNYMTHILLIDMNWHFLWPKIFLASNLWLMGGLYFLYCAHRTNGSDRCWVGWLWRLIDWLHHTLGRTLVNGAITDHTLHIVGAITYITYRCVPHINGTMTERSVQSHIYHISYVIHIISHSGLIKVLERRNDVPSRARALRAEQGLFKQIWRAIESKRVWP